MVYLPTAADLANGIIAQPLDRGRIYKMVSCTGNEGYFIPARIANPILQTIELGSNNKAQKAWTDEMIKEICMPIGQILLYQTVDGESRIEVTLCNNTVWLTLDQMAELFQRNKSTISRHIKNVFESGELQENSVVAFLQQLLLMVKYIKWLIIIWI